MREGKGYQGVWGVFFPISQYGSDKQFSSPFWFGKRLRGKGLNGPFSLSPLTEPYCPIFSQCPMPYAGFKNLATVCTSLSPRPEQLITIRGLPDS
ncbi:hypothetical protein NIES2100_21440 [Calothrix sp. NIES-2100]|nr:hypothetical protein NIES2100_21440 [Calothrix sp. NIES-2100]